MNTPNPISPRQRLKILLAIPENQRTEAQWDEIFELEISLAPGNRDDGGRYEPPGPAAAGNAAAKPSASRQARRPSRNFKRRPKPDPA